MVMQLNPFCQTHKSVVKENINILERTAPPEVQCIIMILISLLNVIHNNNNNI